MEKTDYKQITIDALKKAGVNMDNLAFRYYEKSPYQKKRFKPEFVCPELWVINKNTNKKFSNYCIIFEKTDTKEIQEQEWFNNMIGTIVAETKK